MKDIKIIHLSHVGPSKIPSGGRILTSANIAAEKQLGMDSQWMSLRTTRIKDEIRSKNHLRVLKSSFSDDFPSVFWDHRMSYQLAASDQAISFLNANVTLQHEYVFVLDGPWIWPLLRRFLAKMPKLKYRIVYAAHNAEFHLSAMIAAYHGEKQDEIDFSKFMLERDEIDLIQNSSIVTYLSEHDGDLFRKYKSHGLVRTYVPGSSLRNGPEVTSNGSVYLDENLDWFGFISGDWAPHNLGSIELMRSMLNTPDNNDVGIVFVGSISSALMMSKEFRLLVNKYPRNIRILGRLSNAILRRIDTQLTGYVLPVEFGGGMGIKTIEALQSCKPVFGTEASFRGLEKVHLGNQAKILPNSYQLWGALQDWDKTVEITLADPLVRDNAQLVAPSATALRDLLNNF